MEKDKNTNGLPEGATYVGTYHEGKEPRKETWYSKAAYWTSAITGIVASGMTRDAVSDLWKEDNAKYQWVENEADKFAKGAGEKAKILGEGVGRGFVEAFTRWFDPKVWKSNVVHASLILGSFAVAGFAKRKIEEATFRKENPDWEAKQQRVDKFLAQIKEAEKAGVPVSEVTHAGKVQDAPAKVQQV